MKPRRVIIANRPLKRPSSEPIKAGHYESVLGAETSEVIYNIPGIQD